MNNNSAKTLFDNKTYVFMTECLSTNDYLLKLLKKKSYEEGTMVNISYQKGGRGQRNNEWLSEKGKRLNRILLNCKSQCYDCHECERTFGVPDYDSSIKEIDAEERFNRVT